MVIQSAISKKFNRLYLSLGNGVTGITQSSILSNIGINDNAKVIQNRYKIYFKRNIRFVQNANNYLLNSGYNYEYINKLQYFKSLNLDMTSFALFTFSDKWIFTPSLQIFISILINMYNF